jgi:hypothetical protein
LEKRKKEKKKKEKEEVKKKKTYFTNAAYDVSPPHTVTPLPH